MPSRCGANSEPEIRLLSPADSFEELTLLLHRAYSALAEMGLNYTATYQDPDTTRDRCLAGETLVAVVNGQLVATLTLEPPDPESAVEEYRFCASIHQFGIEPDYQRGGLGSRMLDVAETLALARGYRTVALDTADAAEHLVRFYTSRGYEIANRIRFSGKTYTSLIFVKRLGANSCPLGERSGTQ